MGDIWWASVGENVGSEINGKSHLLSRPVIICKKLAHGFYFVRPRTTKAKVGSWFVAFRRADRKMIASLHRSRNRSLPPFHQARPADDTNFGRVREGFWERYK